MTIDDYAQEVASLIRRAYNAKDRAEVFRVIEEAANRLEASDISDTGRIAFWTKVPEDFRSGRLLIEKQEGSALHQLMRDIERDLAARQAQSANKK